MGTQKSKIQKSKTLAYWLSKVQKLFDDKDNKMLLKSTESHAIPILGICTPFVGRQIWHVNESF